MNKVVKSFLDEFLKYRNNKWFKLFINLGITLIIVFISIYIEAEIINHGVFGSDEYFSTGMTIQILLILVFVLIMLKYNLSDMLKHIMGILQTIVIFIIAMSSSWYLGTIAPTSPHEILKLVNLFLWMYFALGMSYHIISLIRIMVKNEN